MLGCVCKERARNAAHIVVEVVGCILSLLVKLHCYMTIIHKIVTARMKPNRYLAAICV